MKNNIKKIVFILLAVLIIAIIIYRFIPKKVAKVEKEDINVSTIVCEKSDIKTYNYIQGLISDSRTENAMESAEVIAVHATHGDVVKQGQVIVQLKDDSLPSLKLQEDVARLRMNDANNTVSKLAVLLPLGGVSQTDYDNAVSGAKQAKIGYELAKQQYDIKYKYANVVAPHDGTIDTVMFKEGDMVQAGMPLFSIKTDKEDSITFDVTKEMRKNIKIGDKVEVYIDNQPYTATIDLIGNYAGPRLYKCEAKLDKELDKDAYNIKVKMIEGAESNVIVVPIKSIYYKNGQAFVYILEDEKAKKVDVKTGIFNDDDIAILSGLNVGDKLITSWNEDLIDGSEVKEITDEEK